MATPDLPVPDWDHLTSGDLGGRIRSLDDDALARLETYENDHAQRLFVLNALHSRRRELADGAEPSSGDAAAASASRAGAPTGGSPVSPTTSGPPVNPPSQGDPTNPAQPRG